VGNREYLESLDTGADLYPSEYALQQNFPNPFNPVTQINYTIGKNVSVKLEVFNVLGQKVSTLVNGVQAQGNYSVVWDASLVSSGTYFVKLTAGKHEQTKQAILIK